jgi:hypothetical protein
VDIAVSLTGKRREEGEERGGEIEGGKGRGGKEKREEEARSQFFLEARATLLNLVKPRGSSKISEHPWSKNFTKKDTSYFRISTEVRFFKKIQVFFENEKILKFLPEIFGSSLRECPGKPAPARFIFYFS